MSSTANNNLAVCTITKPSAMISMHLHLPTAHARCSTPFPPNPTVTSAPRCTSRIPIPSHTLISLEVVDWQYNAHRQKGENNQQDYQVTLQGEIQHSIWATTTADLRVPWGR